MPKETTIDWNIIDLPLDQLEDYLTEQSSK